MSARSHFRGATAGWPAVVDKGRLDGLLAFRKMVFRKGYGQGSP